MTDMRRTPLYEVQKEQGGKFVPFAGYEMAVTFSGLMSEHAAVRERVGMFDVSHMGELIMEGPQALDALQAIVTNDVSKLVDGKAQYTVMCVDNGGIIDDLIVYREQVDRYFICINASRREADFQHIRQHAARFRCKVSDVSESYAQIALQGPKAAAVLCSVTAASVQDMPAFTWADLQVAGISKVRVARTGYTGEHGYELYCAAGQADALWRALFEAGQPQGIAVCGLGARDTLRLEMKYPLYGNDIDLEHNPIEAGLGWVVKLQKGEFVGRAALQAIKTEGPKRALVGFTMEGRGIPRQGYPIAVDGKVVGMVTSGTHSPTLGAPIGVGYVPAALGKQGTALQIVIRDKHVAAKVAATPFVNKSPKIREAEKQ